MAHHKRWVAYTAVVTAGVLGLAGCAGTGGDAAKNANAFTKYGAMSAERRDPQLAKLAAKEGPVKIYTSFQDMSKVAAAFQKKYPGVKTSVYRADSEAVGAKVQQESQAHRTQADVLETDDVLIQDGVKNKIITDKYKVDPGDMIPGAVHPGWTAARIKAFLVAWNTKKVPTSEVPHSYQDLANPKWKGKLAMEVGDYQWYAGLHDYFVKHGMTDAQFTKMFDGIAANARSVKGHTSTMELLATGEYSIFVDSYDDGIIAMQDKHAPVTFRDKNGKAAVQPVFTNSTGIGILAEAPHPAGAMLFTDFFLSEEGQKIVNDQGNIPARKGINHELDGVTTIRPPSVTGAASKKWQDAYTAVLKHATHG